MRAIFGVLGFTLFGLLGMFLGGGAVIEPYVLNMFTFTNPDDHAFVTLAVNVGTALVCAIVGAFVGSAVGGALKHKVIKADA
ncbi:MAG: hypothetical protein NW215_13575 [Hyphomicrobiales bacterium]|nr:hypothetical protein [Hyphomicrobiales bacterium]